MNVCKELKKEKIEKLFCSEQCTGYNKEKRLTYEMCAPSKHEIIKKVKKYLKKISARRLFIGTDNDSMIKDFKKALKKMEASFLLSDNKFIKQWSHFYCANSSFFKFSTP